MQQKPSDYLTNGNTVPTGPIIATEFDGGAVSSNGASLSLPPAILWIVTELQGTDLFPSSAHLKHIFTLH